MTSKIIFTVERRALRCADRVIVDTQAHERLCRHLYRLRPYQVTSLPLALGKDWSSLGSHRGNDEFEVPEDSSHLTALFIGTLVPLHGINVIAEAAARLPDSTTIRILGDGQDAQKLYSVAYRLQWIRDWMTPSELKNEIASADLMLGVFGGNGKASRVLPWKIYIAMASGKAVVTQDRFSFPIGIPKPPLVTVRPDSNLLAATIQHLQPERLKLMGSKNREFYENYLSDEAIASRWREEIQKIDPRVLPSATDSTGNI